MLKNLAFYTFVVLVACGLFLCIMPYPTFYSGTYNLNKSDISKINYSSEVESYDLSKSQGKTPLCVKLDWNCANALLDFNMPLRLVDVKSELVFNVCRIAGQNHADIRPCSEKDKLIFGGLTENTTSPRPCLVEVKENLWTCASLSTKVQTDKDLNAHYCLYFDGSCSHATGQQDCAHQKAIDYANKVGQDMLKKIAI